MAEDNADRENERQAEREAEVEEELERIDRDPDEVSAGDGDLGTQNAPRTDEDEEGLEDRETEEGLEDRETEEEAGSNTE